MVGTGAAVPEAGIAGVATGVVTDAGAALEPVGMAAAPDAAGKAGSTGAEAPVTGAVIAAFSSTEPEPPVGRTPLK